jgi:hypothetical protein
MNMKLSPRKIAPLASASLVALWGVSLALSAGCGKSEAAMTQSIPTSEAVSVALSPKADTATYAVEMRATGPYKAGAEGSIELILKAKGSYHMNDQYPYKFKVQSPPAEGVSYPKPAIQRADFTFAEENKNNPENRDHKFDTAKVLIPFVAAHAGRTTVAGTFHLSVCSEANCVIDKAALELAVDVK